ncbi:MAG: LacI family transcriptional regulator [Treponema sp.]|jgi:LacI family transcriptional regulator|nr:LacI family transcriptional regulator [Treponema sp.]
MPEFFDEEAPARFNGENLTLAEIARLSGVSIGTVDRVVHRRGKVSAKNRQKIEAVIGEYDYKPNIMARCLKQNFVLKVGLFLPGDFRSDSALRFPHNGNFSAYWEMVVRGIKQAAETLKPFNIQTIPGFWGYGEGLTLEDAGGRLMEAGLDALILSSAAPERTLKLLEKARDIPYVVVDSPLKDGRPLVTIMQNPWRGGQTAGRIMRLLKRAGRFVCLHINSSAYNIVERTQGFKDFFAGDAAVEIAEAVSESFVPDQVFGLLDGLFAAQQIDGIFVPHAEVNVIADYLVKRGLKSRTALIGYDNVPLNCQALADGSIDCIIAQRPEAQGYQAMYEIYRKCVLNQEALGQREEIIEMPIDVYFPENI